MKRVTLYAGPSAYGLPRAPLLRGRTDLRPPVQRGDIDLLVQAKRPGVLVICDGMFHSVPAVSHAEICGALDAGWQVWGVSSIGAIRAHEMRHEGMHGHGWVYERFTRFADFTDDELCLQHLPFAPYQPLTEALVNLRHALAQQGAAHGISLRVARALLDTFSERWFGERSPQAMGAWLQAEGGIDQAAVAHFLAWLAEHRIKSIDLEQLMHLRPWD
jgi:hypothetical protein